MLARVEFGNVQLLTRLLCSGFVSRQGTIKGEGIGSRMTLYVHTYPAMPMPRPTEMVWIRESDLNGGGYSLLTERHSCCCFLFFLCCLRPTALLCGLFARARVGIPVCGGVHVCSCENTPSLTLLCLVFVPPGRVIFQYFQPVKYSIYRKLLRWGFEGLGEIRGWMLLFHQTSTPLGGCLLLLVSRLLAVCGCRQSG